MSSVPDNASKIQFHPTHIYPKHMLPRLLLFALCAFVSANPGEAADRPNIVIFFTDDQGTLDAGCFGSDDIDTPAIDDLAASGVRFTQAYAHVVCCPSRAALMTGRHPQRSGVVSWTQGDRHGSDSANSEYASFGNHLGQGRFFRAGCARQTPWLECSASRGLPLASSRRWWLGRG